MGLRGDSRMARKEKHSVTLLLPALNEENGIIEVLRALPKEEILRRGFDLDIVVVDGHSTDNTKEVAESLGASVLCQQGRGKGCAFRSGLDSVNSDYMLMMDADNSYPAEELPRFLDLLEEGNDVVMGSRLTGEIEPGAMTSTNFLGNRLLSSFASILFGKRVTDVCTGMWGFRLDALKRMALNSTGFEIEAELFAQATKSKLRVAEVPITYRRRDGVAKLSFAKDAMVIAAKLARKRFL